MLTVAKIAAGAPSGMGGMTRHMLTQTVPKEVADLGRYYTRENEIGQDHARLRQDMHPIVAQGLGVDPQNPVNMDQINALMAGRRADGQKIEGKTYSELREYTDKKTGELKTKVPIGAVDFCLTPDKSISVAWAFGVPAEQAAIFQAHADAADKAMAYVEMEMAKATKGKGGKDGWDQGHLGWVYFDHYTSRPTVDIETEVDGKRVTELVIVPVSGDMDLHRHHTVTNAVFCENGRVGSMDLDRLDGFIKEAGALYQAHLAQNLRNIGAEVTIDPDTGSARLPAIPDEVRTHFSKRTTKGEDAAREYASKNGLDWDDLSDSRRAALLKKAVQSVPRGLDDNTIAKLKKDDMADFASWKQQAVDLKWNHETIIRKPEGPEIMGPHQQITPEQRYEIAHPVANHWLEKEGVNQRAVIGEGEVRTAAARSLIVSGINDYRDISGVVDEMMTKGITQYGEPTSLISGQESDKRRLSYTTALHERDEGEFISKAKRASEDMSKALEPERLKAAIERSGLKFEDDHGKAQLKAIHQIGEGGALTVMIGAAGAGKTTLLQPLVDAWQEEGRRVYGMALAWRQADDLIDAGIKRNDTKGVDDSKAISVFLSEVSKGKIELDSKSVIVVDELSLLGTRQGLDLLRLREKHDSQLVMIGDDKQCQAISAGPIIELARKALGPEKIPEILSTIRQETERERDIAGLFRAGDAGIALAMKREDKTVELAPGSYAKVTERVAELMAERVKENGHDKRYSITLSAPTNADAHDLSVAIRDTRRAMGLIGKDLVTIKAAGGENDKIGYEMKIAAGDKVRLFKNVSAQGRRGGSLGRNGSVVTVVRADKDGVVLQPPKGKKEGYVPWEKLVQNGKIRLAYGDVMTTHTAQGSTATEHIYAMPGGTKAVNGFSSYSSGTRHRQKSFMVISERAERAEVKERRPVNDPRPIKSDDLWGNAARNLGYQPVKSTATDFIKRASNIERGSASALQRGLQPGEVRERQGLAPTTIHIRNHQRQTVHDIGMVAMGLEAQSKNLNQTVDTLSQAIPRIGPAVEVGIQRVVREAMDGTSPQVTGPDRGARRFQAVVENIPREHIDALKRSVSISHLIGQSVKLDAHGKGLCPFHNEKTPSFHVNEKKGVYKCFGCGESGDTVKWLTEGRGMPFHQALDYLSGKSGIQLPAPRLAVDKPGHKTVEWSAVLPVPEKAPPLIRSGGWTAEVFNPRAAERGQDRTSKPYKPDHVASYQDAEGRQIGYVLRMEMSDGSKYTPQIAWAVPSNAPTGSDPIKIGRWALVTMGDAKPMYRAEELARHPEKTVIVVMGEKKADALQKIVGNGAVVVSWAGGDNGRHTTDFSPLRGRNVIIWPDADIGGKAAAIGERTNAGEIKKGVAEYAHAAGALGVKVIVPPSSVPKGWDAGDLIKSGADRDQVKKFISEKAVGVEAAKKVLEPQIVQANVKAQEVLKANAEIRKAEAQKKTTATMAPDAAPSQGGQGKTPVNKVDIQPRKGHIRGPSRKR